MTIDRFLVSELTRIYRHADTGLPRLAMAEITGWSEFPDFAGLRDHVLGPLRYPRPQADKFETYGWAPTLFDLSERRFVNRRTGQPFTRAACWRIGESEASTLTTMYLDIDNADPTRPLVAIGEVADRLDGAGLPVRFFAYTTASHQPDRPKFRVVIEPDRPITRPEMLRLAVLLNWAAFDGQGDLSIYDPGDFVFAPPHGAITAERMTGIALPIDAALARQAVLQRQHPECWAGYIRAKQPKAVARASAASTAPGAPVARDMSVRPGIGIAGPAVFNPAWAGFYCDRIVNGSHWETMRSLLGMIWKKTSGGLTFGEMALLLREIDATAAGYFTIKYGERGIDELVGWVTGLPVEADEGAWQPVLDTDETGLLVEAKSGECGQGKTRDELARMAREGGRYVYAADKIASIADRRAEFLALAGPLTGYRFFLAEAHSDRPHRVPLQIANIRKDLNRLPASRPAVVFVTHAAALQVDWSAWSDCELVIDEVPDVFSSFSLKVQNHAELLRRYVQAGEADGNCYRLTATPLGEELARVGDPDDYDGVHFGLVKLLARPNTLAWVKQAGWDEPQPSGKLEVFAITSPLTLSAFRRVRMLGDELLDSTTTRIWAQKWGVSFEPVAFPRRERAVPTAERATIYYFSEHRDSSKTRFAQGDVPLRAISAFIAEHAAGEPVLWTTNEAARPTAGLNAADYVSPKSHGRNDLQHYRRVAWLAAMKASKFEISVVRQVCGMTAQELVDWREYNSLYQFVMRSALRDFDSAEPVAIYVFSRAQAEYLQRRLGGVIHKVEGVVVDEPVRCLDAGGAMDAKERQKVKYWRDKMLAAGAADVRELPRSGKLSEREIRLINATHQRRSAANDDDETAAA
jgi:hypothetical protein